MFILSDRCGQHSYIYIYIYRYDKFDDFIHEVSLIYWGKRIIVMCMIPGIFKKQWRLWGKFLIRLCFLVSKESTVLSRTKFINKSNSIPRYEPLTNRLTKCMEW